MVPRDVLTIGSLRNQRGGDIVPSMFMPRKVAALFAVALVLGGCTTASKSASPTPALTPIVTFAPEATPTLSPKPTLPPTAPPSASPRATRTSVPTTPTTVASATPVASAYPAGSVIATFKVGDEEFRVLVVDPENVAIAQKLLAGKEAPPIPNGVVVRGDPSVNVGYTWHIDPATLEFADMTTEVCDGKPSFVEAGQITGDRFCPWSAKVVDLEPANP